MKEDASSRELRTNRNAYQAMRGDLEREHQGRFALLQGGELIHLFNDRWDAYTIGIERFGEGCFSIKKIGAPPASLGAATQYTKILPIE